MMWPFKRQLPAVELTNLVFSQWLRAQRPPWDWFLSQPAMIQETLATEGDDYIRHCIGIGEVEAEVAVLEGESEQQAVQRLGVEAYRKLAGIQDATQEPAAPVQPLTMGGLGQRRQEADEAAVKDRPAKTLFGRPPDSGRVLSSQQVAEVVRSRGPTAEDYEGTQPKEENPPGYDGMGGVPEPGDGRDVG